MSVDGGERGKDEPGRPTIRARLDDIATRQPAVVGIDEAVPKTALEEPRCLRCHGVLEGGVGSRCPRCGRRDVPSLRRIYWTRAPRLVFRERLLKGLVVLGGLALGFALLTAAGSSARSPGAGAYFLFPLAGVLVAWETASRITHHGYRVDVGLIWTVSFALAAVALITPFTRQVIKLEVRYGVALACAVLAFACWGGRETFRQWKTRTLETLQDLPPKAPTP